MDERARKTRTRLQTARKKSRSELDLHSYSPWSACRMSERACRQIQSLLALVPPPQDFRDGCQRPRLHNTQALHAHKRRNEAGMQASNPCLLGLTVADQHALCEWVFALAGPHGDHVGSLMHVEEGPYSVACTVPVVQPCSPQCRARLGVQRVSARAGRKHGPRQVDMSCASPQPLVSLHAWPQPCTGHPRTFEYQGVAPAFMRSRVAEMHGARHVSSPVSAMNPLYRVRHDRRLRSPHTRPLQVLGARVDQIQLRGGDARSRGRVRSVVDNGRVGAVPGNSRKAEAFKVLLLPASMSY